MGVLLLALVAVEAQDKDGYTDENRPYEFGFVIEGEQHRYEKKDEKGIIMGEYGFITADGVYHVTVYATDEDGNFRILKTKNIRIGLKMIQPASTTTTPKPSVGKFKGLTGCSGCQILTTQPPTPAKSMATGGVNPGQFQGGSGGQLPSNPRVQGPKTNQGPSSGPAYGSQNQNNVPPSYQNSLPPSNQNRFKPKNRIGLPPSNVNTPSTGNFPQNIRGNINNVQPSTGGLGKKSPDIGNQIGNSPTLGKNISPDPYNAGKTPGIPNSPSTAGNKKQSINNTPNANGIPAIQGLGEKEPGQPLSETEKKIFDFMARLYKFNYTLSFHGHEEEGDAEGRKRGSYFNNGRDGFQRKVEYLANEFGYQPKITLLKLDAASTPDEKTEKDFTKLFGSEFIWFLDKKKV